MREPIDLNLEKAKRSNPDSGEVTPEQALRWARDDIIAEEKSPTMAIVILIELGENGYPDISVYRAGDLTYAQELGYAELYKDKIKEEWRNRK